MSDASAPVENPRVRQLFDQLQQSVAEKTDRNFASLMVLQFLFGVYAAFVISPLTWAGEIPNTHIHVWAAILLGGLITSLPVFLALTYPGRTLTRHVVAVGQMLMGALLIHLMGGRIETHFHIFGSLAFLAFYRDWKVVVTGTIVVAIDHFLRGVFWHRSVFGEYFFEPYRWLEHVGWVLFEDLFLLVSIRQAVRQSWTLAQRQSDLEDAKSVVESERDRFFDLSVDMFCVANLEGYFVRVNPMFSLKLGFGVNELLQQPFLEFVHPDDREQTVEVMGQLQQGGDVIDFENRYRCRDGQYIWLAWSSRAPGEGPYIYAVARDVTARKEEAQALVQAKKAAEEANRAKSNFLANMSHEIRTPMNAVLGLTELVLESELTSTQHDYLATVLESGESLLTIINEILDFSKIEAGKTELDFAPFNLREEVGDMMKSLGFRAHRKQLEVAWHADPDVPDYVVGDAARLRQILVNLIGNAIKFTNAGEVVLDIRCESLDDGDARLAFQIRDTGVGIPMDKLKAIFAEFEQADMSTTRNFGGTGLGLSISSRLVELMGGRIEVESDLGKGSRFFFSLSFAVAQPPSRDRSPPDLDLLDGLPVLVVDDNPTNRLILGELTSGWRMSPTMVETGPQAIDFLQQSEMTSAPMPIVVLTDVNMPVMDGYMLAEKIRQSKRTAEIVIIALTSGGYTHDDRIKIMLPAGVSQESRCSSLPSFASASNSPW